MELICHNYANLIFPDKRIHFEIANQYSSWLNNVSHEGLLHELFNASEIDYIKQALMLNIPCLDIIATYRIFCNPNITKNEHFVGDERLITLIKENENINTSVFYRR